MADRTRLSGTQAGGRAGTFCRTGLARLPPSRHPLHCGVRIPDLRARDDSPLRRSCHHALPAICITRRLPAQRIRRCGLNATFRTRLQRCDEDWWLLWQRRSRVAHAALLATDTQICDTVRLGGPQLPRPDESIPSNGPFRAGPSICLRRAGDACDERTGNALYGARVYVELGRRLAHAHATRQSCSDSLSQLVRDRRPAKSFTFTLSPL